MQNEFIVSTDTGSISFLKGKWNLFVGPVASGKSTFLKEITSAKNTFDSFPQEKVIFISDKESFAQDKIIERLIIDIEHYEEINNVLKILGIKELSLFFDYKESTGIYQVLTFLYRYIEDPTVLILDQSFSMLSNYYRTKLLAWLKKDTRKKGITVIYVSMDPEDLLLGDEIILWYRGKKISNGPRKQIFQDDALFRKLGLELPFVVDLYHKLKYYELIDHPVYDLEKMVDELWK